MCNINIIYNKQKKVLNIVPELMNILSWNSFTSNPHGEGYLSLNGKFEFKKSENKLIFKTPSYFLATHQRFATSGLKDENGSHPHFSDGLYVLHNGIIYGKGNEKESDTEIFTKELGEEYKKNGGNCVEAIKTICKKTSGSFSILVYEEKTEKMYYFKDGSTKMFIVESEEWMVMSTSESNVIYAKTYLGIEDKVREFRDMELYDIFQDKYITKLEKDYIKFFDTGTNLHTQRQDLVTGKYTYYIKCIDLGGNTAYDNVSFEVLVDKSPPIVVRAYNDMSGRLKIITDEKSTCSYSTSDCNFMIDDGINMPYVNTEEHYAEWLEGRNYYIRCKDDAGNEPLSNSCSIIVRVES